MLLCLMRISNLLALLKQNRFLNKKDSIKFLDATAEQMAGKAEFRNRNIKVETVDELILVTELCDGYILIGSEWNFYSRFRLSSLLKKKEIRLEVYSSTCFDAGFKSTGRRILWFGTNKN